MIGLELATQTSILFEPKPFVLTLRALGQQKNADLPQSVDNSNSIRHGWINDP